MNKNNYIKISAILISLFIILVPMFLAYAELPAPSTAKIQNPLGDGNDSVDALLLKIMKLVATVGTIVVVFFIIYSGYMFVTAGGDTGKVTKAKDMFYATIIGGAILLGADVIATVVVNTVKSTVSN